MVGAGLASARLFRLMAFIPLHIIGHNDVLIKFDIIVKFYDILPLLCLTLNTVDNWNFFPGGRKARPYIGKYVSPDGCNEKQKIKL